MSDDLARENAKLRKINDVLMRRVESNAALDDTSPFGAFQAAVLLEASIRARTAELDRLNASLREEIDDRTEVMEALESAKHAAERANVMKTRFLAAISHDLMQPLNAARLFLDTVAERQHDPTTMAMLQNIDSSLASVDHLLASLLELARLDVQAPKVEASAFNIRRLLDEIVGEYTAEASRRGLDLRVVGQDAAVFTDPRLFERIVRNLLSNAIRYTRRGRVAIALRRRTTGLRFEVRDSGIGIPHDRLTEIFEEFKQLDHEQRTGEGYGLGLSIVDRIAQLLGVSVDVRSRVGQGSVFAIELPYASVQNELPAEAVAPSPPQPFGGKSALVFGGDAPSAAAICALLTQWGGCAFALASDDDLQGVLGGVCPAPDLLLFDDDPRAFDIIHTVRARVARGVPALMIGTDPSEETRARAKTSNTFVLSKPLHAAKLRSLLLHVFPR
ncbi:MAG: sensor histidine kinase [Vulcanimicrobiaceae bacterium]